MSKHPLRQDKTCLNCRHVVEKRYCPNCGQENTATRKSFHELFVHFFEDLTHYENSFWKTIRNLLLRPASLTKEYLSGKRMSYLAPVRLYIFISFMTFLTIGLLPSDDDENDNVVNIGSHQTATKPNDEIPAVMGVHLDSLEKKNAVEVQRNDDLVVGDYESVRALDSAQAKLPEAKKLGWLEYKLERSFAEVNEYKKKHPEEYDRKLAESIQHNIPKAIFLYMPLFAFGLWIFHGKKRWYYFDHGIFTLHYFSFLLLTFTLTSVLVELLDLIPVSWIDTINIVLTLFLMGWWFFYFFRSHRKFYGEKRWVSRLKGLALFVINIFLISFFIVGLLIYSMVNLH
ncbi:MAG TPA: DUF3667 domain-containing protein [Flavobacterium sp.]|nr:DUF3667 domain-containing protein [Flavobacterium sp.]